MSAAIVIPRLRDGGVVLRPWRFEDIPAMVAMSSDDDVRRFTNVPESYDEDDAAIWLALQPSRLAAGDGAAFAVADGPDEAAVGSIGVRILHGRGIAETGYHVAPSARGRGLATTALRLVSRWALEALPIARLQLTTHVENPASQRVAEKAGFVREGVLRAWTEQRGRRVDLVMYSLLPTDLSR